MTHALTGALVGRALAGDRHRVVTARAATVAGAVAAAFPDADFVLNAFGQFAYLDLHQGVTHSLPMMPVWAWLLALVSAWVYDRRSWRRSGGRLKLTLEFLPVTLAALAAHTIADAMNIWGVMLWWPVNEVRTAFNAIFVIDPLYSALVIAGIVLSSAWRVRAGAALGLVLVAAYTLVALGVNAHTNRLVAALPAAESARSAEQQAAPPSLLHRRFVLRDDDGWRYGFVDLDARGARTPGNRWWTRFSAAFGSVDAIAWRYALHPDGAGEFVQTAWARPELDSFRRFVALPYVYAVDAEGDTVCAWFADLRFALPEVTQPFVWGACRAPENQWEVRQRGRW
ncbi:MAG: metal-dependent hydrolase [Xanthomonadaceae bacterium]|nr:metal-dependent hydrolase [Xanthomonadaceae bacterium]